MLHYTWKEYFIVIGILLFLYYTYVILRYYRKDLIAFLNGRSINEDQKGEELEIFDPFENRRQPKHFVPIEDESYQLAEELIIRIKAAVAEASELELTEPAVLRSIKVLLQEYPTIQDELLQAGITEMILEEFKLYGFISPSKVEVNGLWKLALN
ncbi:hypothetical protein MMC2321_02887 [Chitinophaga sp. MM2321]